MKKLSLSHLDVRDRVVLIRVDFNVPFTENGEIADDTRILAALPSIRFVIENGGKAVLLSHLGRPQKRFDPSLSLSPCASLLTMHLGRVVHFFPDCIGESIKQQICKVQRGEVVLLENLRFHKEEEVPDLEGSFAKDLASLGDVYVNDAFGTMHRKHSSIVPITRFFPFKSAMGFLVEKELKMLSLLTHHPKSPFSVIVGGAKLRTKLGLLHALIPKVQKLFIGGGLAFTFLKALGKEIGDSLVDKDLLSEANGIMKRCREENVAFYLPEDAVIMGEGAIKTVSMDEGIPRGYRGFDIGAKTIESWSAPLLESATVFWNGPMGKCESLQFGAGTLSIAGLLGKMRKAVSIIGGGDSLCAVKKLRVAPLFTHLSTGGGATLAYLEHGTLEGLEALSPIESR